MKNTIILMAVIITGILTYWGLVTIVWSVSDLTWDDSRTPGGFLMLFIGWSVPMIIASDLDEVFKKRAGK